MRCFVCEQGDADGPFECTLRTWERREARFTTAVQRRSRMSCLETGRDDLRIVRTLLRRDGRFPSMLRETATNRNWIVC